MNNIKKIKTQQLLERLNCFKRARLKFYENFQNYSFDRKEDDEREFYSASIQDSLVRIQEFMKQYGNKDCKVYIIHDNPFSKINERERLYSSYKHARKNKNIPPVFYKSLEKLIEILKLYHNNFYLVNYKGCEADDLVPQVLAHKQGNALLISADMDWARGISSEVHWFNYSTLYDIDKFKTDYGFDPSNNGVKMYKCIHGDRSDCIDNAVPYLPKNILLHIVNTYGSLVELFKNIWSDEVIPKQWKLKIKDCENQLKINYQLVDYLNIDVSFEDISYKCVEDLETLRAFFLMLDISFESRMMDAKRDAFHFLEKKRFRRYGNF
jgi:hypothetical protein